MICIQLTSHTYQVWCALGCVNIPLETSGKEGFAPSHLSALPPLPTIHVLSSQLPLVGLQLYLPNRPHEPKAPAPSGKETLGQTGSEVEACKNVLKGRKDIKGNHRIEVLIHSDTSLGEVSTGYWQTDVAGVRCLEICPGHQNFGEIHSAPNLCDVFQPRVEESCWFPDSLRPPCLERGLPAPPLVGFGPGGCGKGISELCLWRQVRNQKPNVSPLWLFGGVWSI